MVRGASAAIVTALCLAASAVADNGAPQLTPAQTACAKKAVGASVWSHLMATGDTSSLTASQRAQVNACLGGGNVPTTGAWIVANPLDLTHVTGISKFRACLGHDYSGNDVQGAAETDRSMKHYIFTNLPWTPADSMQGYAPFAGTVYKVQPEQSGNGTQLWIKNANGWSLVFFHGDPLVKAGQTVTAGQPVIRWPAKNATSSPNLPPQLEFDLALEAETASGVELDSLLLHLAPKVRAAWAAKGFTAANAIISKSARDAAPCNGSYANQQDQVAAK
ncbi:MAG: M23 family metallopeptidase [Actinobacteria bacterium]|nr:M23 family metallopeptidase [Actinomycetota bacterium]MBV8396229.1 M23 family metallopeptidase [Actinomycetota bacterium]MBV8599039.1 M23 family metallopeptidase [Actinomycetota bacterium]